MIQVILEFEEIIGDVEGSQDGQAIERHRRAYLGDGPDSLIDVRRQPLHVVGFCCPGRKPERLSEYVDLDVSCHFEPPSSTRILARLSPLR